MAQQYSVATLESLLSGLSVHDNVSHEETLKHANNVLKTAKGNALALQTKLVALLNLDRFDDALRLLDSADGKKIADTAVLERAYALYKLGKLDACIETAKKGDSRGAMYMAAQACYRAEKFEETAEILQKLSDGKVTFHGEENELPINRLAAYALLAWCGKAELIQESPPKEDPQSFDVSYNTACWAIARGDLAKAAPLLKRARVQVGLADLNEEDKKTELEPIIVQQIYVAVKQGEWEKAVEFAEELDPESLEDESIKTILINNRIAALCRSDHFNPHLALKEYTQATEATQATFAKPFAFQASTIHRNGAILDLSVGKTSAAQKKLPTDGVITGAASILNLDGKAVLKKLETKIAATPTNTGLVLSLVQLRMRTGNITGAITALEALLAALPEQERYLPGLVSLQISLYAHQGRKQHIRETLDKASAFTTSTNAKSHLLLRAAAKSKLDSENPKDLNVAGSIFASLLQENPEDRIAAAGMVAAYATTDADKAATHVDALTPIDELTAGIDISALEAAGVCIPTLKRSASSAALPTPVMKTRKKRRGKLPKNYDADKQPDPERWLPMRDRSYYRPPKGKKGKNLKGGGMQGGEVKESVELAGGEKVEVQAVKGPSGGQGKKKKKKGGKW